MSNNIVIYSNDLNQIALGTLKEQEQNLFFSIIVKLKDRGHEPIVFSATELINMCGKKYTLAQITEQVKGLRSTFFKLDFTEIIRKDNKKIERNVNLFNLFEIVYDDDNVEKVTFQVSPQFEYLVNRLTANFTAFELANFLVLNSKYSKTLFRLLKQFRSTGYARFEWSEFKRLMDIPATYQMGKIDAKVLKPAIAELTWRDGQIDMFTDYRGVDRPAFKNLTYTKIKKNPGKKTSPVIAIEFRWEPEKTKKEIENHPIAEGYKEDKNGNLVPDYRF